MCNIGTTTSNGPGVTPRGHRYEVSPYGQVQLSPQFIDVNLPKLRYNKMSNKWHIRVVITEVILKYKTNKVRNPVLIRKKFLFQYKNNGPKTLPRDRERYHHWWNNFTVFTRITSQTSIFTGDTTIKYQHSSHSAHLPLSRELPKSRLLYSFVTLFVYPYRMGIVPITWLPVDVCPECYSG